MSEAAPTTPPPAPTATPPPPASAGATLTSVPTGEWTSGFKEETRSYITNKGFKTPEALAESYKNLEAKFSSPPDRTFVIPEKLEGENVRPIFERLGAPKDAKGYELPREQGADPKFVEFLEGSFAKNAVTKAQAQGIYGAFKDLAKSQGEARALAIRQADDNLKKEWGSSYDQNLNIAKQGVRVLGLDEKTLNTMEAAQGRDALFKTLKKIGDAVGESPFIDGGAPPAPPKTETAEEAYAKIKTLINDQKFVKKVNRGDVESLNEWNRLNKLAFPGEKTIA